MEVYSLRIRMKGGPKLQRGPQAAGEDSALMQRQGEPTSGPFPGTQLPRDSRPEALREARRARCWQALGHRAPATPLPPFPAAAAATHLLGAGVCAEEPALLPRLARPLGYFHRETQKGNSRGRLTPPTPGCPRGGSPRAAPAALPAPPGSAGPGAAATHPVWRAGWTCTRRRRGWRR